MPKKFKKAKKPAKKIMKKFTKKKLPPKKKREVIRPGSIMAEQRQLSQDKIAFIQSKFEDLKKKNKKAKIIKKDIQEIQLIIQHLKEHITELNAHILSLHEFNDYEILDAIAHELGKLKVNIEFKLGLFRKNFAKKELERIFT